jgi:hypothetical protein
LLSIHRSTTERKKTKRVVVDYAIYLFPRPESASRPWGWQGANKLHASLIKLGIKRVVGRDGDGKAIGVAFGNIEKLATSTAGDTR